MDWPPGAASELPSEKKDTSICRMLCIWRGKSEGYIMGSGKPKLGISCQHQLYAVNELTNSFKNLTLNVTFPCTATSHTLTSLPGLAGMFSFLSMLACWRL